MARAYAHASAGQDGNAGAYPIPIRRLTTSTARSARRLDYRGRATGGQ